MCRGALHIAARSFIAAHRIELVPVGSGNFVDPNVFQGNLHAATLVDLFAGLDWPTFNLEAYVENVFDKRIDLSRQTACGSCTRALVVPRTAADDRHSRRREF